MTILHEYASKMWSYISPRKTQKTREKPFQFKVPAVPAKPTFKNTPHPQPAKQLLTPPDRDLSPESRVNVWHTRTPSPGSDVDITLVPMSPPDSAMQSFEEHDDFEGDTLFNTSPISPTFYKGAGPELEVDANDDTIVVDDGRYHETHRGISFDERLFKQQKQRQELQAAGWSEDAIFLFQKINMRGYEPLMPIEWVDDLTSLPADLFTERLDKPFIKPTMGSHYHAQLALTSLLELGSHVRDAVLTHAPRRQPQYHIKRALRRYTSWAMKDSRLTPHWRTLPLFTTVTVNKHTPSTTLESLTLAKLATLHARWQSALTPQASFSSTHSAALEAPTLYAVSASHTIMALVSYVPASRDAGAGLRLIALFDFGKEGFDVWNALAAAIFVVHCRNRMMELREWLPVPMGEGEEGEGVDPDL
ncbi:hypothetical protein C7974DRAFT_444324 [Boeremia exigua]|uniref:uncharacterized protein n=1 Tax=Boeremia exigua TaxID=749465 RepID=UPI001E8E9F58|nr:uncharacterized protein C7974DRAFT_444324 [Boeremia exigua]KAH6614301.1 hypothetical protein C7974DRAFT_444324 [Boeremia exigua]